MNLELKDKVAIVTGSGKGMGLAAARAFAAEGATVVIADVDGALAEGVAEGLRSQGHEAQRQQRNAGVSYEDFI